MKEYIFLIAVSLLLMMSACVKVKTSRDFPPLRDGAVVELTASEIAWLEQIAKEKRDSIRIADSITAAGGNADPNSLFHKTGLIVALVEVNDHYFPNVLCFKDENGKPVIDLAFPFSANINIDPGTGKAYVYYNQQHQEMLRDKIFTRVKNGGVPIGLSILGNHDAAGWSNFRNLGEATDFARKVAFEVRRNGFSAVLSDDEYSDYQPGADPNSYLMAMSEIKRLLPDIYLCYYPLGTGGGSWNGKKMGEIADACFPDYGQPIETGLDFNFPKKGCFQSFNGWAPGTNEARQIKDQGYGGVMIFNLGGSAPTILNGVAAGLKGKQVSVESGCLDGRAYDFVNTRNPDGTPRW
ncbi:MAG: hypothetical protein DI535_04845 [Citrobacter freundii]|nr:MAG: hypothetical protein DI535_04845 [Citrobacter freundii]